MNILPSNSTNCNPETALPSKALITPNEAAGKSPDKTAFNHKSIRFMPHAIINNPKTYIPSLKLTILQEVSDEAADAAEKPCNAPTLKESRPPCKQVSIAHQSFFSDGFISKKTQQDYSTIKTESTQIMIDNYWVEFLFLLATQPQLKKTEPDRCREIHSVDMTRVKQLKEYIIIKQEPIADYRKHRNSIIFFTKTQSLFSDYYHDFVIKACYLNGHRQRSLTLDKQKKILHEFLQEISCLSKLNHEHIIELFGHHVSHTYKNTLSCFYICPRYADDGITFFLGQMTSLVRFKTMLFLASHIMQALAYLRTQKIIHADIKLDNFLCNDSGNKWCLADFGEIKKANAEGYVYHHDLSGTLGYIAPEIYNNHIYHHQSDTYSFGMSLLYLYSIQNPYSIDLPTEYAKEGYDNRFFITNKRIFELYFQCSNALNLQPSDESIQSIQTRFKEQPESIAETLWETYSSNVLTQKNKTENYEKNHMLALSILMPSIITAAQKNFTKRGYPELFITYYQSLITQYHQVVTPQDEQ